KYNTGEENIFLNDCLKKGLKIKYEPIPIVIHPYDNSGRVYNEKNMYSKGAVFARLFGLKGLAYDLLFSLRKLPDYRNQMSFINLLKNMIKGTMDYLLQKNK